MNKQAEIIKLANDELPQLAAILGLNTSKEVDVQTLALQELQYLQQIGLTNPAIYECEPFTVVMAIKSVLKKNLTLDPDQGLVYVKTRNYKVQENGREVWKKSLDITESANGRISVARQCGRLLDLERPEVIKDANGKVIGVKAKFLVPSYDANMKRSTRWKEVEFDESDFERWRRFSHKENRRSYDNAKPEYRTNKPVPDDTTLNYANPLYTSWKGGIDPEFSRAKAIVHGLKKLGTNANERMAVNIAAPVEKRMYVDPEIDKQVMQEETTTSHDYAEYEEVNHNGNSTNGNGVKVTVVEEMSIPNL
jgi:hypothetical protein